MGSIDWFIILILVPVSKGMPYMPLKAGLDIVMK